MRLLARLARLESRSPVTSLLSVVGVIVLLIPAAENTVKTRSNTLGDSPKLFCPKTLSKLLSDTKGLEND